jgi:hypothetical protein
VVRRMLPHVLGLAPGLPHGHLAHCAAQVGHCSIQGGGPGQGWVTGGKARGGNPPGTEGEEARCEVQKRECMLGAAASLNGLRALLSSVGDHRPSEATLWLAPLGFLFPHRRCAWAGPSARTDPSRRFAPTPAPRRARAALRPYRAKSSYRARTVHVSISSSLTTVDQSVS